MRPARFSDGVAAIVVLSCLLAAGCGSSSLSAKGTVSFAGKPIDEGTISFDPADGVGPSLGGKIEAGRYAVTGQAPPGKKIVRIRGIQKTGRKIEAGPPTPKGTLVDEIKSVVPAIYNDKSKLDLELASGKTTERDFDLK